MTAITGGTVATTTAQAKTGTRSLAITASGGWTLTDASSGITVSPASNYRLTGWTKVNGASGDLSARVIWYTSANAYIRTDDIVVAENLGVWASFSTHTLTPPAGAGYAKIQLADPEGANWWIDDLTLTTVTSPPATTLTERRYYQLGSVTIGSRTRDAGGVETYHTYLGDVRGSTSLAVQRSTTTVEKQWYDPYGKSRGVSSVGVTDRGYVGQYEDTATGLGYLNNRYYDPVTGSFLSVDPLNEQTGEPYIYASGNPTTLSDPTGLCPGAGYVYGVCVTDKDKDGSETFRNNEQISWSCSRFNQSLGARCGGGNWHDKRSIDSGTVGYLAFIGGFVPGLGEAIDGIDCVGGSKLSCAAIPAPFLSGRLAKQLARILDDAVDGRRVTTRVGAIPRGFGNSSEFASFGDDLYAGLSTAGYNDVTAIFQGSSVTGNSFRTGAAFDVGRTSDFDIALASPQLLSKAAAVGIGLRSGGTRTGPLTAAQLERLGLGDLATSLSSSVGRPVNFMVFGSVSGATDRGPSIVVPR